MSSQELTGGVEMSVENIGGIARTEVTFSPGVTVLEGANATNRTSLLKAIMAALGSEDVSLKGDADRGTVELTLDGETYTRELIRDGETVRFDGDPYLEDPTLVDHFGFLLGSNEARQAVTNGEDLREVIMRPVDTAEIEREIDERLEERRSLDSTLEELDSLKDRLPDLEERRGQLETQIEETKAELEAKESELANSDADIEEKREDKAELEERLATLREKRSALEDVRYDLETERESLDATRTEKRELENEMEGLPDAPVGEIDELETRLEEHRERKRTLESDVTEVQNVIGFNQDMLAADDGEILTRANGESGDVTDELLPDGNVACWTCGSEVPREQIESTIGRLQDLSESTLAEITDIEEKTSELTDEIQSLREDNRRREELQRRHAELESEIEEGEAAIERLTDRREALEAEIQEQESEIEDLEDDAYEEVLELHREANQLEYDLGRLEGDLEDVESEISDIEDRLAEESDVKDQRAAIDEEIEDLRTRIDRIERNAVEAFNDHMESVLDILSYSNLERIWLERIETEVREGRRKVSRSVFELHIVRQTDGGTTYEDTIDHLSESEREVTGLVFALAGYLAHEVYDTVPIMLLDSLEAIDTDRIAELVEYVSEYCDYLVAALLAEDAAALDDEYEYISDI